MKILTYTITTFIGWILTHTVSGCLLIQLKCVDNKYPSYFSKARFIQEWKPDLFHPNVSIKNHHGSIFSAPPKYGRNAVGILMLPSAF